MSPKLEEWINSPAIREALQPIKDKSFVDLDPVFNMNIDEDYDYRYSGITKNSFCSVYMNWIRFCNSKRDQVSANVQLSRRTYRIPNAFSFYSLLQTRIKIRRWLHCASR